MIAAAAVLVVLAYPAYLGLFEMPRIHDRLATLEAGAPPREPAWSGAVDLHVLQEPLRGAEDDLPSIRGGGRPALRAARRATRGARGLRGRTGGALRHPGRHGSSGLVFEDE